MITRTVTRLSRLLRTGLLLSLAIPLRGATLESQVGDLTRLLREGSGKLPRAGRVTAVAGAVSETYLSAWLAERGVNTGLGATEVTGLLRKLEKAHGRDSVVKFLESRYSGLVSADAPSTVEVGREFALDLILIPIK